MRWKWIVSIVFVLVMAVMVIGYAILSSYDFNNFKPQIAQAVKGATGRELALAGDIKLGIGLRPVLMVENVSFQNASWGSRPELAKIKRLQIEVSLIALMTGVISVERLILEEPDILIETNKAGNSNLEFRHTHRAAVTEKPQEQASGAPGAVISALLLNEVRIRHGLLTYKDGRSGRTYATVLEKFNIAEETQRLIRLDLEGTYNGRPCHIEGTIGRLPTLVNPNKVWPVTLTVETAATTVTVDGEIKDVFKAKGLALTVTGQGKSLPSILGLFDVAHVPEVGPFKVAGSLTDPGGKLGARDLELVIGTEDLAKVQVSGTIENITALEGLNLAVHGWGQSVPGVVGLFTTSHVPDMGPFDVKGNLTDPNGTLAVEGLTLDLGTEDLAGIRLSGTVKDIKALKGVDVDFSVRGQRLENLDKVVGKPLPAKGPFRISGHARLPSPKLLTFSDVKISLEQSDMAGSLALDLTGAKPRLTASLSAQQLDLRPYLATPSQEPGNDSKKTATGRKGKVFPDTAVPFDLLDQADGEVTIEAQKALLPLLALTNLTARVSLKDGHLRVTPLKGAVGDGTFDSRLDLLSQGREPKMTVALKTVQLDLGRMLKDLGVEGVLEGKLDVDVDATAHGNSVAMLMAGLDGRTVVIMDQGKINEKFVGLLSGDPRGLLQLLSTSKKEVKYRDINCFVVGLDISNGLAKSTALALDTSAVTIVGHGKVDLATEKLDLSLKPTPKKGVGIKGLGSLSVSLGELTKPLKVSGTLAKPNLAIDASGTMLTLGKAVGGAVLLGPVGLAAALAGGQFGDKDPCLAAIEAARATEGLGGDTQKLVGR
jgi:uncharacterized protein involved in outer membrane biogenesis